MDKGVFGKRLAGLRNRRSLTQTQLAAQIGMSHSSVASWETGARDPDSAMVSKLADFFHVSTDYLLGRADESQEYQEVSGLPAVQDHAQLNAEFFELLDANTLVNDEVLVILGEELRRMGVDFNWDGTASGFRRVFSGDAFELELKRTIVYLLNRILFRIDEIIIEKSDSEQQIIYSKYTALPIVGRISCGEGVVAYEEVEGYEPTPRNWLNGGEYFYLRAKGDSMTGARIQEGDLLLIRRQEEVEDGEIAAVLIEDVAVLKRVYRRGNAVWLQSENPNYPPIVLEPSAGCSVKIIGKLKKIVVSV